MELRCPQLHPTGPLAQGLGRTKGMGRKSAGANAVCKAALLALPLVLFSGQSTAFAQTPFEAMASAVSAPVMAMLLSVVIGVSLFLAVLCFISLRALTRQRARAQTLDASAESLRRELDNSKSLVDTSGDGLLLVLPSVGGLAAGGLASMRTLHCPAEQSAMPTQGDVLSDFNAWIEPGDCEVLERSIDALARDGEAFICDVRTLDGTLINVAGRPIGSRLVVRLRDLSRLQRDFADALHLCANLEDESQHLKQLLNAVDFPVWTADSGGLVSWSNDAFKQRSKASQSEGIMAARAVVGAKTQWGAIDARHDDGERIAQAQPDDEAVADAPGDRLVHLKSQTRFGTTLTAGYAMPVSPSARYEAQLAEVNEAQGRMLNVLNTAVCVFNAERHLTFYNEAFAKLFGFQRRVLDERPHDSTVLTYIKSTRQMPESGNHRGWRDQFSSAYTAQQPLVDDWELYDSRFLRVITAPNADGGAIWLFENETEKFELKSRFTALTQVRAATLDALREGVAVFGSNGRLQLVNPAFKTLWALGEDEAKVGAHVKEITTPIRELARDRRVIDQLVGLVGSLGQRREGFISRLVLSDERVVDLVATPLPGGATMLTANDVSAALAIEETLRESNAALEEAARIKTTFIKHVSYELRSPLTSIIGFAQLLDDRETGPMNDRQRDYLNYVLSSTQSLMALVDSILDLTTVDAGILTLSLNEVSPQQLVADASRGLEDRLLDTGVTIDNVVADNMPKLVVDEARMRQVLYNLLANAVNSSPHGAQVRVKTRRDGDRAIVSVIDRGRGMSATEAKAAFEPFETGQNAIGSGAGLGLTLSRALVDLHGGSMDLRSREGLGTVVRCILPLDPSYGDDTDLKNAAE